jgi:hypothetical protein
VCDEKINTIYAELRAVCRVASLQAHNQNNYLPPGFIKQDKQKVF